MTPPRSKDIGTSARAASSCFSSEMVLALARRHASAAARRLGSRLATSRVFSRTSDLGPLVDVRSRTGSLLIPSLARRDPASERWRSALAAAIAVAAVGFSAADTEQPRPASGATPAARCDAGDGGGGGVNGGDGGGGAVGSQRSRRTIHDVYELIEPERPLGQGTFGVVFPGVHRYSREIMAIKHYPPRCVPRDDSVSHQGSRLFTNKKE